MKNKKFPSGGSNENPDAAKSNAIKYGHYACFRPWPSSDRTCGLVQLRQTFHPDEMYGMNYGYRSGLNRSMVTHLQKKAEKIKTLVSLNPADLILDIGSVADRICAPSV